MITDGQGRKGGGDLPLYSVRIKTTQADPKTAKGDRERAREWFVSVKWAIKLDSKRHHRSDWGTRPPVRCPGDDEIDRKEILENGDISSSGRAVFGEQG